MTVKQTATELTIEATMGEDKTTATYKLDGTVGSKMTMGGRWRATSPPSGTAASSVITTRTEGDETRPRPGRSRAAS